MSAHNPEWNTSILPNRRRKPQPLDSLIRRACFSLNWRPVGKGASTMWYDGKTKRDPITEVDAIAERYHITLSTPALGHWIADGPRGVHAEFHCGPSPFDDFEAKLRAVYGAIVMVYVGSGDIEIGDVILESSGGPGKVTDIDADGFPILDDGTRVVWFIRQDGYRFDPTGEGEL